jgi:DNA-binding FadR family transcriptional regulator
VRQGSPTLVLDPDRASDMRLLGLEIELLPLEAEGMTAFAERQTYSAAALLELAEQRLDAGELDALEQIVESFLAAPVTNDPACSFDRAFWTATGKGTRNRIYMREILWYFNLIEREPRFGESLFADPVTRAHLYRALVRTLRSRAGSASLFLNALRVR